MSDDNFIQTLLQRHGSAEEAPPTAEISQWAGLILALLFPESGSQRLANRQEIQNRLLQIELDLKELLYKTADCDLEKCNTTAGKFMEKIPGIYEELCLDVAAIVSGDPAAQSSYEVVRTYPGFAAVFVYRIAHGLHNLGVPLLPRILTEYAHSKTGIDIHPGAKIGRSFFIDHGTGVVIGETAVIGDHVKIYQGVTLGALSVEKAMAGIKRHPTVGDHTVIYSGATILGGDTIIGKDCIIGGNVWLTTSVPDGTKVYHNVDNKFVRKLNKNTNEEKT
jgi:serine O-acetyltransferase